MQKKYIKPGKYWLPSVITSLALFVGLWSATLALSGQVAQACLLLFFAGILDVLDGYVAKATDSVSDFGAELDSLSDAISFGAVPTLMVYFTATPFINGNVLFLSFALCLGTVLRLARFNTQVPTLEHKKSFQGLPSPAATALVVSFVWMVDVYDIASVWTASFSLALCVLAMALMVSNIRYMGIKHLAGQKIPFLGLIVIVAACWVVFIQPTLTLFVLMLVYSLAGVAMTLYQKHRARQRLSRRSRA